MIITVGISNYDSTLCFMSGLGFADVFLNLSSFLLVMDDLFEEGKVEYPAEEPVPKPQLVCVVCVVMLSLPEALRFGDAFSLGPQDQEQEWFLTAKV